ncbi:translation initiation factor 4B [Penicillium lagena]|uniref:translation initiation factor 4B n=1 Tax=Penicillium lagena TaxID=94218 RepID=UPI0025403D30|nr:translation initiation factor 4B [Penicillium lagena]KAJ5611020.1 translation initiation factor 4B [Penicillium lagena]
MAPAKSKAQKMSIGTFLADESLGSWADEMEDMPLPAATTSMSSFGSRPAGGMGMGMGSSYERGGYAVREPLPLPTQPPYTVHVGNLSFDATEADISDLFAECGVTSVRVVEDKLTKAPKGFGYVEFETVDGLKKALDLSGSTLQGRAIRTSIAEPPKDARPEGRDLDWSRRGPLPELPQRRVPDRSSFGRNMDAASDAGSDRGGRRSNFESDGKPRDFGNWERKGPLSPPAGPPSRRRGSPAWGEGRSQEGSRPPRPERAERTPTAADMDNQWRARMRPDQAKEASNPESPAAAHAAPAAPATRPKLNLQKRTVSDAVSSPTAAAAGDSKASPFGAARPIDTAAREKQVEEKRQLAIRQKKEADDKAKAEKAEKARIAKEQGKEEKPADSNKDAVDTPQGGKNFEILRRAGGDDDAGMTADQEAEESTPVPAEAPKEPAANGKWRNAAPTEEAAEDDGWSTVSAKPRNPRRGQAGRGVA